MSLENSNSLRVPFVGFLEIGLGLPRKIVCACSRIQFMTRKKGKLNCRKHFPICTAICRLSDLDPFRNAESSNFTHKKVFQETLSFGKFLKKCLSSATSPLNILNSFLSALNQANSLNSHGCLGDFSLQALDNIFQTARSL